MLSRVLVEYKINKKKNTTQTDFITVAPRGPVCLRLPSDVRLRVCLGT